MDAANCKGYMFRVRGTKVVLSPRELPVDDKVRPLSVEAFVAS